MADDVNVSNNGPTSSSGPEPPIAPRRPTVLSLHGVERIDDWYWLRERDNQEVLELLAAENAYLAHRMAPTEALQQTCFEEIRSHVIETETSLPAPLGPYAYYTRTVEGLSYEIHCRRPVDAPPPPSLAGPDGAPGRVDADGTPDPHEQIVLDENAVAAGHDFFDLGGALVSPDHRLVAYLADTGGGEHLDLHVREIETGRELEEVIHDLDYGLAWSADSTTVFYTRSDDAKRPFQCWRHRLGAPTTTDVCCIEEPDERYVLDLGSTKDRRFIVVELRSHQSSEVHLLDATTPEGSLRLVEPRREGIEYHIEHHEGELLILTNDDAENFKVMRAPVTALGRSSWTEWVAHRDDLRLEDLDVVQGYAVLSARGHASTALEVIELRGGATRRIDPPDPAGRIALAENLDFSARTLRFSSTSLVAPLAIHELDLASGTTSVLWRQFVPGYEMAKYRTERRFARSDDGTEVPMTIAYRADRGRDPGPLLLYGYGSYEASIDPSFSPRRLPLLDRGVAFAIAHVRGGGENGRRWYLDGKLENKHHTFEDFVACARALVADALTVPDRLAARGKSAGGLLMGNVVNLAPELFAAVVAEVPFVDYITTMCDASIPLTVTEWEEWGNPLSSKAAFDWMLPCSPYDNVASVPVPQILVTAGLKDPRVAYFEPTKWVQKLRAAHPGNSERVLLQVEMGAGHFGPSGRYAEWRHESFILAFILSAIGAETTALSS